jgi:hypothetical protein
MRDSGMTAAPAQDNAWVRRNAAQSDVSAIRNRVSHGPRRNAAQSDVSAIRNRVSHGPRRKAARQRLGLLPHAFRHPVPL